MWDGDGPRTKRENSGMDSEWKADSEKLRGIQRDKNRNGNTLFRNPLVNSQDKLQWRKWDNWNRTIGEITQALWLSALCMYISGWFT